MTVRITFRKSDLDQFGFHKRNGWMGEVRAKCHGLLLSAKKTDLGGVIKYLTKQDQTLPFNTSFYWDEDEVEVLNLKDKLDRLFEDEKNNS